MRLSNNPQDRSTRVLRSFSRGATAVALLAAIGCNSLDVTNPNLPDAERALTSATAIEAIAGGTIRSYFNTYHGLDAAAALNAMAENQSASWNNFNMNFYSSLDDDGTRLTRGWQNDPAKAERTNMEWYWQGFYSTASSARDVLVAIRINNVNFPSAAAEARAEAVAQLMLGASLAQIAINYDKGYYLDENTNLLTLAYVDRRVLRDSALARLEDAAALAAATSFSLPDAWTNGGGTYDNTTIEELANSFAAMLLAYWPRTDAENTANVNWSAVAGYAANGLTQDFTIVGDGCISFCPALQSWSNDMFGFRVHTRVANMLDASQLNPYPVDGNPQPNSPDDRLGDGSFGPGGDFPDSYGTVPLTANAGTDFAWSAYEAFNPSRGQYHQSNIAHIRYDRSGEQSVNDIYSAFGPIPLVPKTQNDLILAEALIRSGGNKTTAANLINLTRVGRGGLAPAAAGGDADPVLLGYINYENEIELMGIGATPYYNARRRAGGLRNGTPREMPVPAKELGVKLEPLYSFGGAGAANSPTPP
jgi:hypothetical protein